MSTKVNHFKIGMFVLIGVVILSGALLAFGVRGRFEPKTFFETYVTEDVDGLSVGSPVKLRGVPVGKVTAIQFTSNRYPTGTHNYVLVEFEVKDAVSPLPQGKAGHEMLLSEVRKGLRARVKGQGITGTSILSLEYLNPAENPPQKIDWSPQHHFIPSAPGQFSQMLASIEKSLRNLEDVNFASLSATLQQDLEGIRAVLGQLNQLQFGQIGTNVNSLLADLRGTNDRLRSFVDVTEKTLEGMKLDQVAGSVHRLLERLTAVAVKADGTLDSFGSAPLGEAVSEARAAIEQFDQVLRELKRYPSGFLFGQPPAPARSVDRSRP